MTTEDSILTKPIDCFALSDEFWEMVRLNQFHTLGEIVEIPVNKLLKLPYFGYRVLNELITILNCYGMMNVLKES